MAFNLSKEKADLLEQGLREGRFSDERAEVAREALRRVGREPEPPRSERRAGMSDEQIAQAGRASGREMGDVATFAANVGEGVFGLGPRAQAFVDTYVTGGEGSDYSQNLSYRRAQVEGSAEESPVAAGAGYLTGVVGGGFGAGGLVARGLRHAVPQAAAALTPQSGQAVRNVGRYATAGATGGAAQAAGEGELRDARGGAAAGAVGGPLAAGAVRGARAGWNRVAGAVRPERGAIRRIAENLRRADENPAQAAQRAGRAADEFRNTFGRDPAAAEILDDTRPSNIRRTVETDPAATRTAREHTDRTAREMPARLTDRGEAGLLRGRVSPTPERTQAMAEREYSRFIAQHGDTPVPPTEEFAKLAKRPDFARAVYRNASDDVANDVRNMIQNDDPVPLRSLDTARKRIGESLRPMDPFDRNYQSLREAREAVTEHIAETRPDYADVLRRWGFRQDIQKGIDHGRKVFTRSDPQSFRDAYTAADPALQRGMRWGARSAVRTMVGESPEGAVGDIRKLAEDEGLHRRLRAFLPEDEVQELVQSANVAHRAFQSRAVSTPRTAQDRNKAAEMMRAALEAGTIGIGRASGGFAVAAVMNTLRRLGVSRGEARQLADMAYDPAQLPNVLKQVAAMGGDPSGFRAALKSSVLTGQMLGGGEAE